MLALLQLAIAATSTLLTTSPLVSAAPSHGVDHFLHKRISTDFAKAIEQAMKDASLVPIQAAGAVADTSSNQNETTPYKGTCFPALDFQMPNKVPDSRDNWWCKQDDEYAFLGFSYEVTPCQSKSKMTKEFKDIRERFNGRYIRMYGACDKDDFYNDLIDAAWEAGIGVYALIWFGWENPNAWKGRKTAFMNAVKSNSKAPYVVRALQFGSEPLFDSAISPGDLASQVKKAQKELSDYGIKVTVSDMAFGYEKAGGAKEVLDAIDFASIHTLPFFSSKASTGGKAWPIVTDDIDWFHKQIGDKKVVLSQNGWPSTQYDGVRPNSDAAVANKENEEAYYKLLDKKCEYFKNSKGGGVAWFWHLYADYMEPGYGVLGGDGNPKFDFKPKTSC